ncbi:MAG: LPS assembly lipoprotein LptE [Bacteroidia bacterium]|nr:LPS assembly lipoprotein LptE [Bacteroidia bacterium]
MIPVFTGCWYSFSGASVPPNTNTVAIPLFTNQAPLVYAPLSQLFTSKLQDKFLSQTNLKLRSESADLKLNGEITSYTLAPATVQSNNEVVQNRLTMTVLVRYSNYQQSGDNWEQSFSNFVDFSGNFADNQQRLSEEVSEKIAQDIFNRTLANW